LDGAFAEAVGGLFFGLISNQNRFFSYLHHAVAIFMQIQNGLWNCLAAMGFCGLLRSSSVQDWN
jgi:putative oxidoreductase